MTIDTHAHLNFNAYKDDADEVIRRSLNNDVWMINVGSTYKTSKRAIEIAKRHEKGVYAAIGLHPIHLAEGIFKAKVDKEKISFKTQAEEFDYAKYKELARSEKVVAVGEVGLDYYYRPKTKIKLEEFKQKQRETLFKQIGLAEELGLPVIFHCRMANEELIEILDQYRGRLKGVIHCFFGTWQQAEKYLGMGFYLGFNGIIFKLNLEETIEKVPPDRILIETDCPYLTPLPMTGRNEPAYIRYIAEKIAKIRKLSADELTAITFKNAKKLFGI